jgi:hypothetical protein
MYFSPGDEKAFFDWLEAIPTIKKVGGRGYDLHIKLKRVPSDANLREPIALFHRYRMDMKPLAALKTSRNARWFCNPQKVLVHGYLWPSLKSPARRILWREQGCHYAVTRQPRRACLVRVSTRDALTTQKTSAP